MPEPVKKQWEVAPKPSEHEISSLRKSINASEALATLLIQRGIKTFEDARHFFSPSLKNLHNPYEMKGMQKAVDRIVEAVNAGENIMVYGDYDVDGTTAVALMYSFLHSLYPNVSYYVPDRYLEGYGISTQGIDFAADNGISLLIALDCGIKAVGKVDYANSKGIDVIICDHHLPGDKIPDAVAVLDPKQADCPYPYKELTGCAIGFKLIQALGPVFQLAPDFYTDYLDLCAISIACDIVPITGENRILCSYGIEVLQQRPRPGIKSLMKLSGLWNPETDKSKLLNVSDLVFYLGPRINAAGRMEHANEAVELLLSNEERADETGNRIQVHNTSRKEEDKKITEEALALIESDNNLSSAKSTVLFQEHWHKGVIGIVASRVMEHYYRPTILLTLSNGKAVGSARSVRGFNVYEAICQCEDLLEQYGGHFYAAGLTLDVEKVPHFQKKFEEIVSASIHPELLVPKEHVHLEITLDELTDKFLESLLRMAPFGPENMRPLFLSKNLRNAGYSKIVGKEGDHLKLNVCQGDSGKTFNGIAFGFGKEIGKEIVAGVPFDAIYNLEPSEWMGRKRIEMQVRDLRLSD